MISATIVLSILVLASLLSFWLTSRQHDRRPGEMFLGITATLWIVTGLVALTFDNGLIVGLGMVLILVGYILGGILYEGWKF